MDAAIQHNERASRSIGLLLGSPHFVLALQAAAFWQVWQWMAGRFATSAEAGWEILPLISVVFMCWISRPEATGNISPTALSLAAAFMLAYSAAFFLAPPLIRAVFAMMSVAVIVSAWRFGKVFQPGIFALFLLSLPVTESLNFFLGYPMRVVVGEAVKFLLRLQGLDVYREGTGLHFGEQLIWIDAPCSGVKMLWFGTFLTVFLATVLNVGMIRLSVVLATAIAAIIFGNILRASALFYVESGLVEGPPWMHSAVGVVAFAATSIAIVFLVKKVSAFKWQK